MIEWEWIVNWIVERIFFLVNSFSLLQACEDEYDYHHKLFGQGAVDRYFLFSSIPTFVDNLPAPGCSYIWSYFRDFQFHNPQLVKDYVNQIRRV